MTETVEYRGYAIEVKNDNSPDSPREWDNLGTMVCWSRRYSLGDEHVFMESIYSEKDGSYTEIKDEPDDFLEWLTIYPSVVLPIYKYEHGGICLSTSNASYPFNDMWDAGQIGWIYVTHEKIAKEYGWKRITNARRTRIEEYLKNEIKVYNMYLNGEVYGFEILDCHGEYVDSCYGYYGEEDCIKEAKSAVDAEIRGELKRKWLSWSECNTMASLYVG